MGKLGSPMSPFIPCNLIFTLRSDLSSNESILLGEKKVLGWLNNIYEIYFLVFIYNVFLSGREWPVIVHIVWCVRVGIMK